MAEFKLRSIEDVLRSIRDSLSETNSPIKDFAPYTNLYAIFRAFSSVITEQEFSLARFKDLLYINSSNGVDLDTKARDYDLYRLRGSLSKGFVLVSGYPVNISKGTILTSSSRGLEYELTTDVSVVDGSEIPVGIKSISYSELTNLEAGSVLYSSLFPSHTFIVGKYRDTVTNKPIMNLSGGSGIESDQDLRSRILTRIKGTEYGTKLAIEQAVKKLDSVNQCYIYESTPMTGYFTVYIDSSDLEVLSEVKREINKYKPIGVRYEVKVISYTPIDVYMQVKLNNLQAASSISSLIKGNLSILSSSLKPGETLYKSHIMQQASRANGVREIIVTSPSTDIIPKNNSLVRIDNVNLSFSS